MQENIILTMNKRDLSLFDTVHNRHPFMFSGIPIHPPKLFSLRMRSSEGDGMLIRHENNQLGIVDIKVTHEVTPLLSAHRQQMPDSGNWEVSILLSRNKNNQLTVKMVKPPKDYTRLRWLMMKADVSFKTTLTNLDYFVKMYTSSMNILEHFPFALNMSAGKDGINCRFKADFEELVEDYIKKLEIARREQHRFDGWDLVNITWEQFDKIWNDSEMYLSDFDQIPLKKFALRLSDRKDPKSTVIFKYTAHGETLHVIVEQPGMHDEHLDIDFNVKRKPYAESDGKFELMYAPTKELKEDDALMFPIADGNGSMQTYELICMAFDCVSAFMLNYKDVATDVEEREYMPREGEKKQSKHKGKNTVRLFKTYTLKKGWRGNVKRKKAEIHCLAWGVRGHFRHYKNGKTIFIESYVKGKDRSKYEGKQYALFPQT